MADEQWFYADAADTTPRGPVSVDNLRGLLASGALPRDARVWTEGMAAWATADTVAAVGNFAAGSVAAPVKISSDSPVSLEVVSTDFVARPAAQLAYQTPVVIPQPFAGFWIRFVAWMIDWIIVMVAAAAVQLVISGFESLGAFSVVPSITADWLRPASLLVGWLYFSTMESSATRATLGKMALRLAVINEAGARIGFGRATARYFAKYLSSITIGIGYFMAGWTARKQGLHDLVAGTLVIRRERNA